MVGEMNLSVLLKSMEPKLLDSEYVFVCIEGGNYGENEDLGTVYRSLTRS